MIITLSPDTTDHAVHRYSITTTCRCRLVHHARRWTAAENVPSPAGRRVYGGRIDFWNPTPKRRPLVDGERRENSLRFTTPRGLAGRVLYDGGDTTPRVYVPRASCTHNRRRDVVITQCALRRKGSAGRRDNGTFFFFLTGDRTKGEWWRRKKRTWRKSIPRVHGTPPSQRDLITTTTTTTTTGGGEKKNNEENWRCNILFWRQKGSER